MTLHLTRSSLLQGFEMFQVRLQKKATRDTQSRDFRPLEDKNISGLLKTIN
jgi:hypothetical protein